MKVASSNAPTFKAPPRDPRLAHWLKDYPPQVFSERLYESIELMERYSIELAIDLLRRLDVIDQLGKWQSAGELCQVLFSAAFPFRLGLDFEPWSRPVAWRLEPMVTPAPIICDIRRGNRSSSACVQ